MSEPNSFPISEKIIMAPCHRPEKKPDSCDSYPEGAQDDKLVNIMTKSKTIRSFCFFNVLVVFDLYMI